MSLFRYVLFTSAMLLGLLFLADRYFPATPVAVAHDDVDRTSTPIVTASPAPLAPITTAEAPAPDAHLATVAQADTLRLSPSRAPEQIVRPTKPTQHSHRDSRRRLAQRSQRLASYRAPDWESWSFASW